MIEVRCFRTPWNDSLSMMILARDRDSVAFAQPLTFVKGTPGEEAEPTFRLSHDRAQMLIDELWGCGLRPSEGTGSAGSLKATERHLEDMRKLALDLVAHKLKEE